MEAVLALAAVGSVVSAVVGFDRIFRPDTRHVDRRLLQYGSRRLDLEEATAQPGGSARAGQVTRSMERALAGRSFTIALQTDLARADLKLTVAEFVTLQTVSVALCAALAYVISGGTLPAAIFFALVGFVVPRWWVGRRQAARLKAFNDQLADTITLLGNSLRSGLSLVQAMEMVAREGEPPISDEFQRVIREIGLGVNPQDALLHMVRRIASDDLDLVVTAVLVQFEVGGNLAKILDTIAATIRERVKIKGDIKTLTAQQRGSGYMLAGMPVLVGGLFMLIAPDYLGLLFSPGPWLVLPAIAGAGMLIGFVLINKITDIEV